MTSLVDDNGSYLDYDGEDFLLSKQSISILNFQIKGDKSVNFKIDNTGPNRKKLGIYGPNQVDSPILSKIPFNVVRNGNQINRGFIVVESIKEFIKCYFVGGNASWISDFQFNIQEVDFQDDFTIAWDDVQISLDQLLPKNYGITFPFTDWIYNRQKQGSIFVTQINLGGPQIAGSIQNIENTTSDFYPCFYLKNLVDYVFRKAGYKIAGDILTDTLYNQTVITPPDGDVQYSDSFIAEREVFASVKGVQSVSGGVTTDIAFTYDIGNPFLYSGFFFISPGLLLVDVDIVIYTDTAQSYTISGPIGAFTPAGNSVITVSSNIGAAVKGFNYTPFNITATSGFAITKATIHYKVRKSVRPQVSYLNPVCILPSMSAAELIKAIAIRFGCIVTYSNQTLTFTKIDSITQTEDWSEYLKSYEYIYNMGFKNNYIRTPQPKEFDTYNLTNKTGYGDGNFETDFNVNQDKELYSDPFAGALDSVMATAMQWCQPYIPMVTLSDSDPFTIVSITDNGGFAQINGAGFTIDPLSVVRVYDINGFYSGMHTVQSATATAITLNTLYVNGSSGYIYKQNASFNSPGSRLLVVTPGYPVSNIGIKGDFDIYRGSLDNYTLCNFPYFSKPTTGRGVDQLKQSLSYGAINLTGYNDVSLQNRYRSVVPMLSNPIVRAKLLLPESVFANFNSDKKIYLTCKDFTGLFWVEKPYDYKDGMTEVEVDLLFTNG